MLRFRRLGLRFAEPAPAAIAATIAALPLQTELLLLIVLLEWEFGTTTTKHAAHIWQIWPIQRRREPLSSPLSTAQSSVHTQEELRLMNYCTINSTLLFKRSGRNGVCTQAWCEDRLLNTAEWWGVEMVATFSDWQRHDQQCEAHSLGRRGGQEAGLTVCILPRPTPYGLGDAFGGTRQQRC